MTDTVAALRYARALLAEAARRRESEAALRNLDRAVAVLRRRPDLLRCLRHPLLPVDARLSALEKQIPGLASSARDFFRLLLAHRRIDLLSAVRRIYEKIFWRGRGFLPCAAETAVPLGDPQRRYLERHVRRIFRRKPRISYRVNRRLLAGVRLRAQDRVVDLSLRGMLENLAERLRGEE